MYAISNADGKVGITAREYDIATTTAIKRGAFVKLSEGLVVLATAGETGQLLGVAAETHSGIVDAINLRSNGKKILVYDAPDLIYECKAPVITATAGSSTTVVSNSTGGMGTFSADAFNGGYVKLFKKADSSTNSDVVGTVRRIEDFADATGTETFTVETGGITNANDKYMIFPPLNSKLGNLNADRTALVLSATAQLNVKTVGHDIDRGVIKVQIVDAVLGE